MKPDFCQKIYRLFFLFVIFVSFYLNGRSQSQEILDFSYKVDSIIINHKAQFEISVTITKGDLPCILELLDKSPSLGGDIISSSGVIHSRTYKFTNLEAKEYYIYLYSSDKESGRGKRVQMKTKNQ
jgi:hypothetical protein